ncbi:MAG: YIP1 family protein [Candidatus Helarchaeota archaeon]
MDIQPIKNFFKNYIKMFYAPTEATEDILSREANLLEVLALVCISSFLVILGVFIYQGPAGPIYNIFQYYSSTFILEQITTSSTLGYSMITTHYSLIFLKDFLFVIKMWIFFSLFAYIWMKVLGVDVKFVKTFEITAWALFPLLSITILVSLICILLNLIPGFGLYAYLPFYIVLIVLIIIVIPPIFSNFIIKAVKTSDVKVLLPYYLTLLIFFILFMYNHLEWLARYRII